MLRGASLTALGQGQEGLSLVTRGIAGIRATGAVAGTATAIMVLAWAYARLGQSVDGLNCLAEAAQIIETTGERHREAMLHLVRGELLNATGDPSAAERSYHQAIAVAKLQSAKPFELSGPRSTWRTSGANRTGAAKPAIFSPRSTVGSPKASTRFT